MRATVILLVLALAHASVAAPLPPDPATGILKFHRMHDGPADAKSVLMIQDRKYDTLKFTVDMTLTPTPQTAVLTFSATGISKRKVLIPADGKVTIRLPKVPTNVVTTATLQIDALQPYVFDTVVSLAKLLFTGQSNAAMTELLMCATCGTPLMNRILANPNCDKLYFYHSIAVLNPTAAPAGAASTPQDDFPIAPTHGWINCRSPNFAALIGNNLNGFSRTGLAIILKAADLTDWSEPLGIISTAVISTTLAAWSSAQMIEDAGVHSYIVTPRNALNTASALFNGQLAPQASFALSAVARFQGESNAVENKTEFGMLLPVWHDHMRNEVLNDPKLTIIETQLTPFVGSAAIPQRYDIVRDDQVLVTAQKHSYLVPTWDLHDEIGRTSTDSGTHNIHNDITGERIAERWVKQWFGKPINCDSAEASRVNIEYRNDETVEVTVTFSGVRDAGLSVQDTPGCSLYPGCATAPSPIEVHYGHEWVPVSSIFNAALGDTENIGGNKIAYVFSANGRRLIDGIRITTDPRALKFVGDGYPVKPFVFLSAAPSQ
jgi:hypothetical protein